ncbi:TrkH family potassium uptake protein [Novispirillum sp. DQ9]|uniref:TrkH family potassium uptake protein n=1 Tax=Novispirillum sp. DQ9 TaxID=3398612 RepID=UPI003C7D746E
MIDPRPVLLVIGLLLTILSGGMLIPAIIDLALDNADWQAFAWSGALGIFLGLTLVFANASGRVALNVRQAFLLTVATWVVLPAFAAVPFTFSEPGLSYTDAYFEAMSGVTTTGATVMVGLDHQPPGLLMWRAILQWLGGLGIIVMALTVLPMLKVGGMQMFKVEAFEAQEKIYSRATQIAAALTLVYGGLTLVWALMLWIVGMPLLEAVAHAMSTIATGGYSTRDASVGHFDSALIDAIITVGMVAGGIPFLLFLQVLRGRPLLLWRDSQVRWYLGVLAVFSVLVAWWLWAMRGFDPLQALRYASFNVVSVMTGTGFATSDFNGWGGFPVAALFLLMFVGGCAGSTTCGIKVFRFQILYETAKVQLGRLLQPHAVFIPYFNGRPIQAGVSEAVMGFFFLYALTVGFVTLGLGLMGLDLVTALSGAATAVSNVGPGLGPVIGPAGNFSTLPDAAKWLLSLGMLLGRLEIYTVLVLLVPRFWRD